MISKVKIAIIGCGNLGASIANGLLKRDDFDPTKLTLTKRHVDSLSDFAAQGVNVQTDNSSAAANADIIILGVKPYNDAPFLN